MSIYQHYRTEEKPFIDQVLEWIRYVNDSYSYRLLDFLDPRQQEIVTQLANYDGQVSVSLNGGIESAERKRAIISPPYYIPEETDYELAYFELIYPDKFFNIEHRQLLGSLMNLGIVREKFGDLVVNEKEIQFVVANEIADFVQINLQSVGRAKVKVNPIKKTEMNISEEEWNIHSGTVSSMRIDAVLSEIFNVSRAKAATYIQKGAVKVNWKVVEQAAYECCEHDTLSVRGLGRAKVLSIDGQTRKNKWRIQYGKK